MVDVVQIETPALGDRSYLVHDGRSALVIDPQRDIDRVFRLAGELGVAITHVAETHIHNDYLSGGLALSRAAGASYLVNAADPVRFRRTPVTDGDQIEISPAFAIRALATPGHTFTHLSYVLTAGGSVTGVFTGGSLLYGATGRPDLLGPEHTQELAMAQYATAHRLARELPGSAGLYPTHGFGSFCSAGQASATFSTLGQQKLANPVLTLSEQAYLETTLAGLDTWPAYYAHMGPANLAGPEAAGLAPPARASPAGIFRRIKAGGWVIDLRDRPVFAAEFVRGAVSFPLEDSFASYLGWTVPWGSPLTLLGDTPEQVAAAQRELARIGFDRLAALTGQPAEWVDGAELASIRLGKFTDLAAFTGQAAGRPAVLDVRRPLEWDSSHIAGAIHIPLHDLPGRLAEVPPGELWVHCQSGYRAIVAASLLAARRDRVVSIDDDFGNAGPAGLPLTGSLPGPGQDTP